jgi:hypothetical protein
MKSRKPKLLVLDIETSPALGYFWRMHDENISLDQMITPSRILSVGWKWRGEDRFHYRDVWPHGSVAASKAMLKDIHTALNEADGVITFNGSRFDLPKLTGEFLVAGMDPCPPVASIDVYKTTKKMGFTSNKLAHVAPLLGCGNKLDTGGFKLWREYMQGDKNARKIMKLYNWQDVEVLEKVYNRIRPYITDHVYMGVSAEPKRGTAEILTTECPTCESLDGQHRGRRRTKAFWIDRIQCLGCGRWYDGKRSKA